ncbi:LacI family DNA-binding transcriptional regulator [Thermophagus xiamenensis]|uniref:Transcriptional regulator, LacI family n=1 Tax=Thermophagus xiamenensis TaxID=385682 RepID=A0A1I2BF10_9BACT|nr:LacI family DNA-binding transcriptional regulator [Thermophagus xiamenensis]SFE54547.1 transcriptional regulator, LacI family [Thermophagus xiamenensis]
MAKKHVTITDIANKMGITPSTVSRALAGNQRVSAKTRSAVLKVAEGLGYRPNALASSLRRGRSDTIGMIVPRINRHFFSHVISGVEAILNPAGYSLLICQTHEREEDERKAVRTLLQNRVGAIIISHSVETYEFDHLLDIISEGILLIQFDRVTDKVKCPRIINDNFLGALRSTRHLIKNGCKRIAHFAGALHVNVYRERFEGYKYALKQSNIEFDPDLVVENCIVQESGEEAAENLYHNQKIDAIFAASDFSALGALKQLRDMGIKIPQEIKICGFANEPFAGLVEPGLTSVEQNAFEMGNQIARSIISNLEKDEFDEEEILIPVSLIPRASSMNSFTSAMFQYEGDNFDVR